MTTKAMRELLDRLLDERDEFTRLKCNAILRGAASIDDCPDCVRAKAACDRLYERLVKAAGLE